MPENQRSSPTAAIEALTNGRLSVVGRLPWSSNFVFLLDVDHDDWSAQAIYKPFDGEQPLWDFPEGIYKREVAAYELSAALGWSFVPPTVVRTDGPFGVGSLQLFIPSDFEQHYFTLAEAGNHDNELRAIATFDVVANNADRKGGHCLASNEGPVYAIDNALCFNVEPKLRTVIWDFGGETVRPELLEDLDRVLQDLPPSLEQLLTGEELDALRSRISDLLTTPQLPEIQSERQYPWPVI